MHFNLYAIVVTGRALWVEHTATYTLKMRSDGASNEHESELYITNACLRVFFDRVQSIPSKNFALVGEVFPGMRIMIFIKLLAVLLSIIFHTIYNLLGLNSEHGAIQYRF